MENERLNMEEEIAVLSDRDEHRQRFLKQWLPVNPELKGKERLAVLRGRDADRNKAIEKAKQDEMDVVNVLFGALAGGFFIFAVNMFFMLDLLRNFIEKAAGV